MAQANHAAAHGGRRAIKTMETGLGFLKRPGVISRKNCRMDQGLAKIQLFKVGRFYFILCFQLENQSRFFSTSILLFSRLFAAGGRLGRFRRFATVLNLRLELIHMTSIFSLKE